MPIHLWWNPSGQNCWILKVTIGRPARRDLASIQFDCAAKVALPAAMRQSRDPGAPGQVDMTYVEVLCP